MVKNMTEGSPSKHILSFTLPLLLGNLFQQLYNIADAAIVGQFLGTGPLSAVGNTGSLMFLIIGFVMGICTGFGITVSRYFGAKDVKSLCSAVANILYLSVAVALLLTAFSSTQTPFLLNIMGTPEDIWQDSYSYIHIIFTYGILSSMFYNVLANILRALGDSRTPLYFLIIASVCNILLDLFFILACDMGVAGAGIATVISQFGSGALCLIYMVKKFPILRLTREDLPFSGRMGARLMGQGLPMALQFSITAVGSVVLQSAVNSLGSGVVASVTAANKVQPFVTQPMESVGITMATYCGQNLGAEKVDRIKRGMLCGSLTVIIYAVAAFLLMYFVGGYAIRIFVSGENTKIIEDAVRYIRTCAYFYPALGLIFVFRNSIQGLGYSLPAMIAGIFELVARSAVAILFVTRFGYAAVCVSGPAAWLSADILLIPVYFIVIRVISKRISLRKAEKEEECCENLS